jgi:hypothetical protein
VHARALLALAGVAAFAILVSSPARATKVCAWTIPVVMVDKVYSGNARAGYGYAFRVTQDAAAENGTNIPAGTMGYGIIRSVSAAGRHNHDGSITLEPRYLIVPMHGGGTLRLEVTMNPTLPVTWTPTEPLINKAASHVPLPVPGLIMTGVNQVRWGRNITLGPGFVFSVLPVEDLAKSPVC